MSNWNNPNNPNNTQNGWKTPSRSSPQGGGTRACLCKDKNTYSKKCCDGTLWAQGIGNITRTPIITETGFLLQQDGSFILQQDSSKIIITT